MSETKPKFQSAGPSAPPYSLWVGITWEFRCATCKTKCWMIALLSQQAWKIPGAQQQEAQNCKRSAPNFENMLHKDMWIPIRVKTKANSYNGIISSTGLWSGMERMHCRKKVFFEKAFSDGFETYFLWWYLGKLVGTKNQDYGFNIKIRAKPRLKTSYEVYIAVLMVQSDCP